MEANVGVPSGGGTRIFHGACTIKRLCIFNDKFGNDSDNEMGKVLYFHPPNTDEDTQLKQIGLSEAIIRFATKFNTRLHCESLHTQKTRVVFHTPESGYWFVLVLTIPSVKKHSPDGVEFIEYLGDEVQDDVFRAILEKLYRKFVLLNDTMEGIYKTSGLEDLCSRLKKFFDASIGKLDASQCGLSEIFTGLQFFPLERAMFLRIQCFINKLLLSWPSVKHVLLMQGDRLIWSGIEQNNIQIFYDYLVNDLLSKHFLAGVDKQSTFGVICKRESHITLLQEEHSRRSMSFSSLYSNHPTNSTVMNTSVISNSNDADNASFMTASTTTINGKDEVPANEYKKFHMLIYKAEQTYLTLLVPDTEELVRETINKLEVFLNVNFTSMARQLAKVPSANSHPSQNATSGCISNAAIHESIPPNVKFIYFNSLNLAERASPTIRCEIDAYKLLADLRADLARTTESGEITMKAISETWVVAKTANGREFYAIFNQTGANVLDIDEELRKLTDAQLTNIFFQD
ncbi:Vacuolar fusion protein CCZ1 [Orchesella cincta]|uniref:Vacuolar fusion protein CCZ1 n=1 Tax=Orchesella cincta TaxID=48709 RepID=A0A1D2MZK4_ORCCI|nr:Vacuolar fusion protein CCZ1 [Orchesella cincta]